jgi:hypothetical protein
MGVTNAQNTKAPDQKIERLQKNTRGNDCGNSEDCTPKASDRENNDEGRKERRARSRDKDDDDRADAANENKDSRRYKDRREARDWHYNPRDHRRSTKRDSTFRFYFGGYYYPQRYWDAPVVVLGNRVSCREGREIVDDSGFNRVRTVECRGRNYTYTGRRHGDSFRIVLNSRNGRIVSVREL